MNRLLHTLFLFCSLLLLLIPAAAQQKNADSLRRIKDNMIIQAAMRYPLLCRASIQYGTVSNTHYTATLHGKAYLEGDLKIQNAVKGFLTLPVYAFGKQEVSATIGYIRQEMVLQNTVDKIPESPVDNGSTTLQTMALSLGYKRKDSLFGKPFVSGGSLIVNSSLQSSIDKTSAVLYGIWSIKTTRTTYIGAGLVVLIDRNSTFPALPTLIYWHRFTASPWELSIDIPTHAFIRHPIFSKGLLSLGTELSDNTLFKEVDQPLLPVKAEFKMLDLKTGFTIDYPICKKLLIGCNGGMMNKVMDRMLQRNNSVNDYAVTARRDPCVYFNIHLSLLPNLLK